MTDILTIHPTHPQARLIERVVAVLQRGGVIAYPTDSGYALGCHMGDKEAVDRIRRIRALDKHHHFTVMCSDLADLALYARVDNWVFRLLKAHTPGAYTFILPASKEVPRRLMHPKRKTIGLRVPDHAIAHALMDSLHEALMSVTLIMPGDTLPLVDIDDIEAAVGKQVDMIVDGGYCGMEPTSVIDLTCGTAVILREGKGDTSGL